MFAGIAGFSKGIERAYAEINGQSNSNNHGADASLNVCLGDGAPARNGAENADRGNRGGAKRMPKCIGFSEIGTVANGILRYRYPDVKNYGDASKIVCFDLPDFDFLCGGFPCQSWSIAGKRKGFEDARGTLFYEIARILSDKRPRHFLLENVKGLFSADGGKAFAEILRVLTELDYRVEIGLFNSKDFGVPQNRERCYFIGHLGTECSREILSFGESDEEFNGQSRQRNDIAHTVTNDDKARGSYDVTSTGRTVGEDVSFALDGHYYKGASPSDMEKGMKRQMIRDGERKGMVKAGTLRTHNDGKGFRPMAGEVSPSLNARARQDGSQQPVIRVHSTMGRSGDPEHVTANVTGGTKNERYKVKNRIRRLTPVECARLQGFEDDWADVGMFQDKQGEWHVREISNTGKYQVFGNAVTVNVITAIISEMREKGCLTL